ncbi:hypothetical protein PV325_003396 [Microctonus aethiopoides]|uniref:Ubiquitin-like domain-containing protein n=1 Tax=Microctonus aethiopoides TaxID=144406 RepID=A0AA39FAH4_9HYME|nr:hypothetical protein PV325_003396 [Microctonus aethiopoides]KAK0165898.1 hypothetical protein PV328_004377 [Microctonus aethiopoides]
MEGLDEGGNGLVRLLVRASNQQIDDHVVKCKLDWTVGKLKDYLEEVYPNKPKRAEQKVIFSGQLLNDSMVLKDVLQQYYNEKEETFIVHLVCPSLKSTSTMINSNINKPTTSEQLSSASSSTPSSHNGARVNVPPPPPPIVTSATQPSPLQQYYGQLNNQQMAWMQQAYAHYLTQYMQLMAAQGIQLQSTLPYNQSPNSNVDTAVNNTLRNNRNNNGDDNEEQTRPVVQGDFDANLPNNNNINNNNNNNNNNINNNNNVGGDENEAGLNRDWLDVFDVLARVVVLFSIVYFYSSPSRFIIVTFLGFAIYLIQGGFFRGQQNYLADNNNARENNQVNDQVAAPQAPTAAAAAATTTATTSNTISDSASQQQSTSQPPNSQPVNPDTTGGTTNHEERTTNVNEDNERPGALALSWTFFSSFFASLIPEQPHVI